MRTLIAAAMSVLVLAGAIAPAIAGPPHHRGYGWGHHNHWGKSYQNPLGGFWGGVVGGAIGGWLSRPTPPRYGYEALEPYSREWFAFCSRRYRSFDPESGTYLGFDGERRFCR